MVISPPPFEFVFLVYVIAIAGGLVAGGINTLAGTGSAITLPILYYLLRQDPNLANGTNRIGIILAAFVATETFRKNGVLESKGTAWLYVPAILGGAVGAIIAIYQCPETMQWMILAVMVFCLAMILAEPWIARIRSAAPNHRSALTVIIFFLIGVYGGFIQAGVGVLLLAALVTGAGYTLVKANAIKVLLVSIFTVPALVIFAINGQVHWRLGLVMAAGQCVGAWCAARWAAGHPKADVWIRRLLIVIIVLAIAKLSYDFAKM